MRTVFKLTIATALFCLMPACPSPAAESVASGISGWHAVVGDHDNSPTFLIAVDKNSQKLFAFERKSPFALKGEFPCSTGQNPGDKQLKNDLKTPEGIYFVERHITSGLNYELYGHEAYPLNYPNPVDRLRKKTGSGIWIHGKGVPLVFPGTQGCVGMNNEDIASLGEKIALGQPVALAESVIHAQEMSEERLKTVALLEQKVIKWADAWSGRSAEMFDFYNADAYGRAQGQSFASFRAQKEMLFKSLPWIDTQVSDVQILEGPGYWVTWFNQVYNAPNLKTRGTRRLYWQQDAAGDFRIVGMEWINNLKSQVLLADAGKKPALPSTLTDAAGPPKAEGLTLALGAGPGDLPGNQGVKTDTGPDTLQQEAALFIETWRKAWENADIEAYKACYSVQAVQGSRKGIKAITDYKRSLWSKIKPLGVELGNISFTANETKLKVVMIQTYSDDSGYSDTGIKTVYLERVGGKWRIIREDWSK